MKRFSGVWIVVVMALVVFISGCANPPTVLGDNNTYINVIIQQNETSGMAISQFAAYACDSSGNTITSAEISMKGPDGAIAGSMTNGVFIYQDFTGAAFQLSSEYAVSVTCNAANYYATVSTNGAITIAVDGSTVTWGYDAEAEMITVTTPVPSFLFFGPALNSPFNLNTAGAYAAGSGTYTISATMTDQKAMAITAGADVAASAMIQHMTSIQVDK